MYRALMFSTPEEFGMPFLLSARPELLMFLSPEIVVGDRTFHADALLRLSENGRNRMVAVVFRESGHAVPTDVPMPVLELSLRDLIAVKRLIGRVRRAIEKDPPHPRAGWSGAA